MTSGNAGIADFNKITKIDFSESLTTVCIAYHRKFEDLPTFETLPLSAELAEEFKSLAQDVAVGLSKEINDGSVILREYDAGSKLDDNECEYLDTATHPQVAEQVRPLKESLAALEVYKPKERADKEIKFYAVIVQPARGEPVLFLRTYNQRKDLRFTGKIRAMFAGEHFRIVHEPEFLFDKKIDCIIYGRSIYIIHKENFQKIFKFFELVLQVASETIEVIKANIPIANFDEFEAACGRDMRMVAKLRNIAARPYLNRLTMEHIKKVKSEIPSLKVDIVSDDGAEKLVFDKRFKWELLRLLDDDYLKSIMTGLNYEVNSKRSY